MQSARAYANNEVAFIAWNLTELIEGCLGFEITRIYVGSEEPPRVLASWVPFRGQANPHWKPQTTSVWPVQKLCWRDLTLRRRRDSTGLRPSDVEVKYRIRPLGRARDGREAIPPGRDAPNYDGEPIALAALDEGVETNVVRVTSSYGTDLRVAFTNGILSAQWLKHALEEGGEGLTPKVVRTHIANVGDPLRKYLAGDVLDFMTGALATGDDVTNKLALYELGDTELADAIKAKRRQISVILSNSSKGRDGEDWDQGNARFRNDLHEHRIEVQDRMFNNGHIGHNKFVISVKDDRPFAVLTGSTNWTPTGLCGQSNNVIEIRHPDIATAYADYWERLRQDTAGFKRPVPLSASTANKQGAELREHNARTACDVKLADGKTRVRVWFSPNTRATTKKAALPPDLADVYSRMRKANEAIFFAVFMPSRSGKLSIIEEAIDVGTKDSSVLVYGAVSDPTAMPNYVAPQKVDDGDEDDGEEDPSTKRRKIAPPALYDTGNVHVIRAAALGHDDVVGSFEAELLKLGNAIIHDKIVVIDPLSEGCTVIVGSHNLGYKASYENDENLLVIEGNPRLAQAYAVHILDLYDHYRFRAAQAEMHRHGRSHWEGTLEIDDGWLRSYVKQDVKRESPTTSLVSYFAPLANR
ncbi:MAG: hypothetical protein E6J90_05790 [Deltaproteobacteria bacterium]|nr:MAG: hypothetical protein E6J91_49530 [Deltaproteobacteria bacterium]TMQ25528.1 MAG: hypothetical protein E6J90_05790 [Deltaproteobacteria bacterium]